MSMGPSPMYPPPNSMLSGETFNYPKIASTFCCHIFGFVTLLNRHLNFFLVATQTGVVHIQGSFTQIYCCFLEWCYYSCHLGDPRHLACLLFFFLEKLPKNFMGHNKLRLFCLIERKINMVCLWAFFFFFLMARFFTTIFLN